MKKGDKLRASISALAYGGEGISKDFAVPVFVARGVVGDVVELTLLDVRKDFAKAKILDLIEPSNKRVEPPCKLFKVCGGCQWQHIAYTYQLEAKTEIVRQAMKHIGGLQPELVLPAITGETTFGYRNKVQFPAANPANSSRILAGYYEQNSHKLVNIKHCPIQPEILDKVLATSKILLEQHSIGAYEETKHTGLLRHIVLRYSFAHSQILVILVVNADPSSQAVLLPVFRQIAHMLQQTHQEIVGVCLNFNPQRGNRIMGRHTFSLAGDAYLIETLKSRNVNAPDVLKRGISFQISAASFFQVNSEGAVVLLDTILKAIHDHSQQILNNNPVPLLVDAYAGVGAIALWLSCTASKIIGIEAVPQAIADAQASLKLNQIKNVEFQQGEVEEVLPELSGKGLKADVIILDPPRKGISAVALEAIVAAGADQIIYVSCNPATLARDLKIFAKKGYKTIQVQPIDMFPHTYHVEVVAILAKGI